MRRSSSGLVVVLALVALVGCVPEPPPGRTDTIDLGGGMTVNAEVPEGQTVDLAAVEMTGLPAAPDGFEFPFGAFELTVGGVAPGSVTRVQIGFSAPVDTIRKLWGGAWDRFVHDGLTGALLSEDGMSMTLDLHDGGRGDTDGAANGVIEDPIAPADAAALTITTVDVPVADQWEPYSFQLQAAGATGTVHWTLMPGSWPFTGLTLSDSGLLSGTAASSSGLLRVQAEDDVGTAAKVLWFAVSDLPGGLAAPTGVPLPDGSRLAFSSSDCPGGCAARLARYRGDGTVASIDTASVDVHREIMPTGAVSPDGTRVVLLPETQPGPAIVADADTGATLATLATISGVPEARFSPDGTLLALRALVGLSGVWVYDTSDWHLVRSISPVSQGGRLTWSPDSSSFALPDPDHIGQQEPHIYSADPSGVGDRTIPLPVEQCSIGQAEDWSVPGRLAVKCMVPGGWTIATASAGDGSGFRPLVTSECISPTECVTYDAPVFAPSGGFLAIAEVTQDPAGIRISSRMGYVSETGGGPITYLTTPLPAGGITGHTKPLSWR